MTHPAEIYQQEMLEQQVSDDVVMAGEMLGHIIGVKLPQNQLGRADILKSDTMSGIPENHDCTRCMATAGCGFFSLASENNGNNPFMDRISAISSLTAENPAFMKNYNKEQREALIKDRIEIVGSSPKPLTDQAPVTPTKVTEEKQIENTQTFVQTGVDAVTTKPPDVNKEEPTAAKQDVSQTDLAVPLKAAEQLVPVAAVVTQEAKQPEKAIDITLKEPPQELMQIPVYIHERKPAKIDVPVVPIKTEEAKTINKRSEPKQEDVITQIDKPEKKVVKPKLDKEQPKKKQEVSRAVKDKPVAQVETPLQKKVTTEKQPEVTIAKDVKKQVSQRVFTFEAKKKTPKPTAEKIDTIQTKQLDKSEPRSKKESGTVSHTEAFEENVEQAVQLEEPTVEISEELKTNEITELAPDITFENTTSSESPEGNGTLTLEATQPEPVNEEISFNETIIELPQLQELSPQIDVAQETQPEITEQTDIQNSETIFSFEETQIIDQTIETNQIFTKNDDITTKELPANEVTDQNEFIEKKTPEMAFAEPTLQTEPSLESNLEDNNDNTQNIFTQQEVTSVESTNSTEQDLPAKVEEVIAQKSTDTEETIIISSKDLSEETDEKDQAKFTKEESNEIPNKPDKVFNRFNLDRLSNTDIQNLTALLNEVFSLLNATDQKSDEKISDAFEQKVMEKSPQELRNDTFGNHDDSVVSTVWFSLLVIQLLAKLNLTKD